MIDSTSCKAHHRRAPGLKKNGPQSIGASCGGLNTKIHAVCDALCNPLRFKLTPGNRSDVAELPAMISSLRAGALLADKGYDSDAAVALAESLGRRSSPRGQAEKSRELLMPSAIALGIWRRACFKGGNVQAGGDEI